MKLPVYSVRDLKVGFGPFMLDTNDYTAQRNFRMAFNNSDSVYNFASSDFDLYKLGYFDSDTGRFEQLDLPELILSGGSINV